MSARFDGNLTVDTYVRHQWLCNRHGMTYTEEDWVDEKAISRRALDE
jgi:hypothetical protein